MDPSTKPIIFLMGPTASGKTSVAVELVRELPLEIISVDSAMVYRDMDIGTAKPSREILDIAPHRLIDVCDPAEPYSAGNFVTDALREIADIHASDRIPLLVGGTGLYFRSLEKGFSSLPAADKTVRKKLEADLTGIGLDGMYQRLLDVDCQAKERIHPNDPQRILRALEIYELTGKAPSAIYDLGRTSLLQHPIVKIIMAPDDRKLLHAEIETRFLHMLDAGLLDEVKLLHKRSDLGPKCPSMRLVGYRQVWSYLEGESDYNSMINKGIIATRQLAKRQLTWLRSERDAIWLNSQDGKLSQFLLNFLRGNPLTSGSL